MSAPGNSATAESRRAVRAARLGLVVLVCAAGLAPLLADGRPLVVRAALPSVLAAEARQLAGASAYDLRRGTPGVEDRVRAALDRLPGLAAPGARPGLVALADEWASLCRAEASREIRCAFLARAGKVAAAADPARLTFVPAVAGAGRGTAAFVTIGGLAAAAWLLRRRAVARRSRRRRRLAAGVLVLATITVAVPAGTGVGAAPPGFPVSPRALIAEDPDAIAIWPPIPFAPDRPVASERLAAPLAPAAAGGRHWLGTDDLGRDLAALVVWGARTSLAVGFASVAILLVIGIALGAVAGYCRGVVDRLVTRLIEVFQAFPALVLILAAVSFLDGGLGVVILVIGCTRWSSAARLVRGEFLRLREADFVAAARALGCSAPRIVVRHMLPGALGPVLVHAAFAVAAAVLVESSLAFLGLGDRSVVSWGQVIDRGRHFVEAWWVTVFPGVGLFLTVLVLRTLGEGLRAATGPRVAS